MFQQIFNFSMQRTWKESILYYLMCFFFIALVGFISGMVSVIVAKTLSLLGFNYEHIKKFCWNFSDIIFASTCILPSFLFVFKKRLINIIPIGLLILAIILTIFVYDIVGLIPAAILSTFPNRNISE